MSYVCLWSPAWPTGAAFDADLTPALLALAPRVVVGDDNRIWVDARGMRAASLAEQLLTVVRAHGVPGVRAGVAMTPIAAECAAVHTHSLVLKREPGTTSFVAHEESRYGAMTVVKPGTDRDFIAPFPVSVLEPDEFLASLLEGLGIDTVGRLANLEAGPLEVRLGVDGVRLWSRARAEDDRWLFTTPIRSLPTASLEWMEYSLRDSERLLFVINSLLASVCTALTTQGERARELTLVFSLADRTQYTHPLRSARPTADQKRWLRIVRDALEQMQLPDAVMGISIAVDTVTGNDGSQGDLFDRGFASADAVETILADLADEHGDDFLVKPASTSHPLAERRNRWVAESPTTYVSRPSDTEASLKMTSTTPPTTPELTLQLLPLPQPILVDTTSRRDHEVPIRYRDEKGWHQLVDVAGPDRVSGGEWESPFAREYFKCVREDGTLVWMFMAVDERSSRAERADKGRDHWWFLQGWWD
jgi:nucleotidyltransferase/DNA polymerase involved in DNA repair